MESDPIVAEIRKFRELRAARFGFDIRAIVRDAQKRDAGGEREIVRRPARRPAVPAGSDANATTAESRRAADRG